MLFLVAMWSAADCLVSLEHRLEEDGEPPMSPEETAAVAAAVSQSKLSGASAELLQLVAHKQPGPIDAIVLGSGLAGLSCAAVLARTGKAS